MSSAPTSVLHVEHDFLAVAESEKEKQAVCTPSLWTESMLLI